MRVRQMLMGLVLLALAAGAVAYPLVASARDDVGFCLSCHLMDGQGQSYETSYHRQRTEVTCSTCHTSSLAQKYQSGAWHLFANLTGVHPDEIELRESSRSVVAGNCAECHSPTSLHARTEFQKGPNCMECHKGHDPHSVHVNGFGSQ